MTITIFINTIRRKINYEHYSWNFRTIKPGADFASSTDFIEEHLLESMEILQLVSELNDEFDINITLPYIKPENFKSVESIYNMVQEILEDE